MNRIFHPPRKEAVLGKYLLTLIIAVITDVLMLCVFYNFRMESTEKCDAVISHFNGKFIKTPAGVPGKTYCIQMHTLQKYNVCHV